MKALANLPIRTKLAGFVVLSTFLSLGTGFALVIYTTTQSFEDELIRSTRLIARVVGDYSAISLAFNDKTDAELSLAKLEEAPYVTDAIIYDAEGQRFATHNRSGDLHLPAQVRASGCAREEGAVHCFMPIQRDDELLGTIYVRAATIELDARVRGYVLYMLLLMIVLVIAGLIFAYLLQGFISEPILELARAARQISDRADYSLRVTKPGQDEIGVLYDGFNAMLAQIQERQQQLERSNRDLDQFAYVASHDLKAPLRAITTLSSWIEEDLAGKLDDEGRRQMELLRSRVRRMDALIEGILHYSRIGRLESRGERVEVARLLAEVVEAIDPPAGFRIEVAPAMPVLHTHRLRLEQVFTNLISNAIQHHHRIVGRVEVSWRRLGDVHEFTVADDGPGIAREHQARVFMMFQSFGNTEKGDHTGLGLSLVKKLVEEEGGSISLESEPGHGCRFCFTWPETFEEPTQPLRDVEELRSLRQPGSGSASGSTSRPGGSSGSRSGGSSGGMSGSRSGGSSGSRSKGSRG